MDPLQQKGSPHQGAATHAAHVRESFTCSVGRMQHLRKKKAVKQKRTRDLYYALDPRSTPSGEAVHRVSQGLRLLFANHPRVPDTVEGECLLHYVNVSHTVEFERGRCSGA